ncbi:hypothetical protein Patl1_12170 [Pistacia atlantica]|uniref:Uncharacterized protein n=1 Tax=Pistacia atlantica TaxID=434234 RepID=A0ACC1A790_9ROSI|nr:hypothetical protein Patl1_12170 [Pistacia atlantica]
MFEEDYYQDCCSLHSRFASLCRDIVIDRKRNFVAMKFRDRFSPFVSLQLQHDTVEWINYLLLYRSAFYIYLAIKEPLGKDEPDPAFLAKAKARLKRNFHQEVI